MENEKSPNRAFFVLLFSFSLPDCSFARLLPYKHINIKNKRYGFFSISLVLFPLIETGWNLPCKQVLCIMKRLRHGKHLSMISFLPTQCMIFSIRFVVQSVKDFHPCKPIRKTATSTKSKATAFSPIPLNVYFLPTQTTRLSLPEFVHRIAPPVWIDSHHASLFWKLLHLMQNKSGRASTHTA